MVQHGLYGGSAWLYGGSVRLYGGSARLYTGVALASSKAGPGYMKVKYKFIRASLPYCQDFIGTVSQLKSRGKKFKNKKQINL